MKKILAVVILVSLALIQISCGVPKDGDNRQEVAEVTQVKLILDYIPNTNHTGFYVAKEKGFFEEEGINLEIVEPVDGITNTLVATGKGDFGISYQEDVTYAKVGEETLPIKAIATLMQHNTSGIASLAKKNINTPKDFEGKTYAGWGSPAEEAVLRAIMKKAGADPDKLNIITADDLSYTTLENNIDLLWLFWAWDVIPAQNEGVDLNFIHISDYDDRLDYYTPVIVTSDNMLKTNPQLVKAFLRAAEKGYMYAIENPKESAEILSKHVENYDKDLLIKSQEYISAKYMEGNSNWGEMKEHVWSGYMDFMKEYGLINEVIEADKCFTNEYLPYNNK